MSRTWRYQVRHLNWRYSVKTKMKFGSALIKGEVTIETKIDPEKQLIHETSGYRYMNSASYWTSQYLEYFDILTKSSRSEVLLASHSWYCAIWERPPIKNVFFYFPGRPVTVYIDVLIVDIGEISVTDMVRLYVFLVSWALQTKYTC